MYVVYFILTLSAEITMNRERLFSQGNTVAKIKMADKIIKISLLIIKIE